MKTSELSGALLDLWVAKAQGATDARIEDWGGLENVCVTSLDDLRAVPFQPSSKWAAGGPIIEKERIEIHPRTDLDMPHWGALPFHDLQTRGAGWELMQRGPTPLVAAMRAVVAAKFGDEVNMLSG